MAFNWSGVEIKMWPKPKIKNLSCYEIPCLFSSIYSTIEQDTISVTCLIIASLFFFVSAVCMLHGFFGSYSMKTTSQLNLKFASVSAIQSD